ncbi:hypothetical protein [Nocardia cyriacigeorgica]|uniref:hypothetical protein n=1 Tax=Nocardia cyriacigeorgica TaxID=135487 RepID=UPI0024541C85|nr:hypothetical protein [Nocardia cyriacigeorgica]
MRCSRVLAGLAVGVFAVIGWAAAPALAQEDQPEAVYECEGLDAGPKSAATWNVVGRQCVPATDTPTEGDVEALAIQARDRVVECANGTVEAEANSEDRVKVTGLDCVERG